MKELNELHMPEDARYSENHEWAKPSDGVYLIGITDYAQDQLGDIVFVDLPEVGAVFHRGEKFGTVESTKAVSELCTPLGGEVVAVNAKLEDAPELVNQDPYESGWMISIRIEAPEEGDEMLDREEYLETLKGL